LLPRLLRHVDPARARREQGERSQTLVRRDRVQGGWQCDHKGLGRTKYEALTLERGVTQSTEFEEWANAAQVLIKGHPSTSLANLRKPVVRIELLTEGRQPAKRYLVYNCWVSEFQALSDLDAGGNAIAIEHIKIEHEGWERDLSLTEPKEI
jgi:phage tail-like protein